MPRVESGRLRALPALLLTLLLSAAASRAAEAALPGSRWELTPFAGYMNYIDAFRDENNAPFQAKDGAYYGGRLGYMFRPNWGIEAAGGYSPTKQESPVPDEDLSFSHYAGDLLFSPIHKNSWDLFLMAGGGYNQFTTQGKTGSFGSFDAGGGLRLWFSDNIGVRAEARNILAIQGTVENSKDNYLLLGGGLVFAFGKARDTDGDGVPDKKDKCPDTPKGAHIDANGCPTDADGDGVPDGIDQCSNTPKGAKVDAKGCPTDSDGDGVPDGIDQCADTPKGAQVDANGCPVDSDGDGVPDGIDQCANTPVGAVVDATGCPKDSDGDGIFDGLDKCPDTPANLKVDKDGCPIQVSEKETEFLDTGLLRMENINFETGKATLLPESSAPLDDVGQILGKWPELRIEIGGHTDSRGSEATNQTLSEARAKAVEDYLVQHFPSLTAEQFTVKGYGESKPLVPNTNQLNMAKNRRVEFKVLNRDVLKREVERRKLLNK